MRESLTDAGRDLALGSGCVGCGRPGRVLCAPCRSGLPVTAGVAWPTPTPPGLAPPFAAGGYEGLVRTLVLRHKEDGVLALATPLGRLLAAAVTTALAEVAPGRPGVLLVPVPSRRAVVRTRGHDPLLRVTRAAASALRADGVDARVARLLVPVGRVRDQAGLDARARARNLAGSLAVRRGGGGPRRAAPGRVVVVVDDVLTTGSTAREAQRALEAAGVPVAAVATAAATRRRWTAEGGSLAFSGPAD